MLGTDPNLRYFVYSLESDFPPWDPYSRSDDLNEAISVARAFSLKSQTTVYVVDVQQSRSLFGGEVYVHLGPFYKDYLASIRNKKVQLLRGLSAG